MPANFDLSNLALKALAPNNELLYDDKGLPSVMVKVPKATYADLGLGSSTDIFPAFKVGNVTKDYIYASKYPNIVMNGRAYSLPGEDPGNTIYGADALAACTAKGRGWHLMTRMEWMALALWCKKNNSMPKGNNNYGKDTGDSIYQAIPSMPRDSSNRIQRVATGTGPLSWSHDGTPSGIWDLNGNVSEWVGGIRFVKGELQILPDNNAADSDISQALASDAWKAVDGTDGSLITPDGNGTTTNSLKLDWTGSIWKWITGTITDANKGSHGCTFESVDVESGLSAAAILLLQALGMYKYDTSAGAYLGDYFYHDNSQAERGLCCGGAWSGGAFAGVFYAHSYDSFFSNRNDSFGFRSAFVEL